MKQRRVTAPTLTLTTSSLLITAEDMQHICIYHLGRERGVG
jgi:hypothetical protein